jgi:glycosyl transferase family 87
MLAETWVVRGIRASQSISVRAGGWGGRAAAAVMVAGYFVVLLARGGQRAWGHFGVPAVEHPFSDMRSVTSAWECVRRGVAVLPVNPCDPRPRPANYPTIWLLPSHLGLGQSSTVVLGTATAVIFFACALAVIPHGASLVEGGIVGIALCSPSVMLGVERGNTDLLVFAVVVAAVWLLWRSGRSARAGPLLLLFAAVLKLFPIVASIVLLRLRGRRWRYAFAFVLAGFGVYALATLATIHEIYRVVPQLPYYSYGIKPFGAWAANLFASYRVHLPPTAWEWLLIGGATLVAVAVRSRVRARLGAGGDDPELTRDLDFFVVGAAIYVGTFSLFQNFEYRLVFVLLTIPQLYRWTRGRYLLGATGLLFVLSTLWLGAYWNGVPLVDTLIARWEWLTSQRPFFGADKTLTADASAQVVLAVVLIALLVAVLPTISIRDRRMNDLPTYSRRGKHRRA